MSILRDGRLVLALGAIRAVPLGEGIDVRVPDDLVSDIETACRRRDPTFELHEFPIQLTIDGVTAVLPGSGAGLAEWLVGLFERPQVGIPGIDECMSLARRGLCSDLAVNASARLIGDGLTLEGAR
jgi:hypothetical protein